MYLLQCVLTMGCVSVVDIAGWTWEVRDTPIQHF